MPDTDDPGRGKKNVVEGTAERLTFSEGDNWRSDVRRPSSLSDTAMELLAVVLR